MKLSWLDSFFRRWIHPLPRLTWLDSE